jgi:hypothetical protein
MSEPYWQDEFNAPLRTLQIIVAALFLGLLVFLAIAVAIVQQKQVAQAAEESPLTYIAIAFAATMLVARLVVGGMMVSRGRQSIRRGTWKPPQSGQGPLVDLVERTGDAGKLWFILLQRTIVSAAMIEGATFFLLIAYTIEGSSLALTVAVLLMIGVALHFPTRSGSARWVGDQLHRIEQDRQLFDDR